MKKLNRDCKLRWLGHAAFQVTSSKGKIILIDPWLDNPKAPKGAFDAVTHVDVILPTHGHFDHLGQTISIGSKFQPEIPCSFELSAYLESKGLEKTIGMNKGGTVTVAGDIKVSMVHADHSSGITDEDFPGQTLYGGEATGVVVELENGFRFYHAGDTDVFQDMKTIGERYSPELAILPIGGHFTMGPDGAAAAARMVKARYVVPIHYGTFPILAGTPQELESSLSGTGIEILALEPGETLE